MLRRHGPSSPPSRVLGIFAGGVLMLLALAPIARAHTAAPRLRLGLDRAAPRRTGARSCERTDSTPAASRPKSAPTIVDVAGRSTADMPHGLESSPRCVPPRK